jgi:ectoine hydroxylase-related dioxygenase (phytanoyl-CoA dioxygenase family)
VSLKQQLLTDGWAVVDLPDPTPVFAARDALAQRLRDTGLPDLPSLDRYHEIVSDGDVHIDTWHALSEWFWEQDLSRSIIEGNLDLVRGVLGPDLHIQRYPYLRAVRPGHGTDAAPIHRDTYYGSSPMELVAMVPFTDIGAEGAMRVITGSHVEPDADYPYTQKQNLDVPMRSKKHRLGYSYAPRLLDPSLADRAEPVPVKVGQVLLFVLSLVHGGGTNSGDRTRFSVDIRLVNSLAGVSYRRGVHDDYYVPLCESIVTLTAAAYRAANEARPATHVE